MSYSHDFNTYLEAMEGLNTKTLTRRSEAEVIIANAINDRPIANFLSQNLKPADDGLGFEWRINVAAIAANMDNIIGFPTFRANMAYRAPSLFIVGGASNHVQPSHMADIKRLFPYAKMKVIANAGHWVHAEKPAEVTEALCVFLGG